MINSPSCRPNTTLVISAVDHFRCEIYMLVLYTACQTNVCYVPHAMTGHGLLIQDSTTFSGALIPERSGVSCENHAGIISDAVVSDHERI